MISPKPLFAAIALAVCAGMTAAAGPGQPQTQTQSRPQGVEDAASGFYAWALEHPSWALPSAKERARMAGFMSPELLALLAQASAMERRCVRAAPPGDKPLVLEGDLLVGLYEGATEVSYGQPVVDGDAASVEARLVHIDARFPKAHRHRAFVWTDRLQLRLRQGRWLVTDARFAEDGALVSRLEGYLDEGRRSCMGAP